MRRRVIMGAALALFLGAVAPATAQDTKTGEVKTSEKASKARRVDGTVKSVQSDGFVVSGKEKSKEREWAFAITEKTTMKRDGKMASAGELKAGDVVTVNYVEQSGKVVAQSVTVK